MVTYTIFSDTQKEIVSFKRCASPLTAFQAPAPEFTEWWANDVNLGESTWMLSVRTTSEGPEYLLWDSKNTGYLNSSAVVLSSANVIGKVPMRYFFWWAVLIMYEYLKLQWVHVQLWCMLRKMYITTKLRPYRSRISRCCVRLRRRLLGSVSKGTHSSNQPETR